MLIGVSAKVHAQYVIPGSFDTAGFGLGTGAISNLAIAGSASLSFGATTVQPDKKILLAGTCQLGAADYFFCIARLNADGTFDQDFDGPSLNANGRFLVPIGLSDDRASALALQSDGKIVVVGTCVGDTNKDFCAARLNSNGTFDTSFGGGTGRVLFTVGANGDNATAVAIQPDGKIVIVGFCSDGTQNTYCAARLNANGTEDTSFDGPGTAGNGKFLFAVGSSFSLADSVAIQSDGKLVIAGRCTTSGNVDFCLARLNANGSYDTSFSGPVGGANGRFAVAIGSSSDVASAVAIQPDGKILVAGGCLVATEARFCVARFLTSGLLDVGFDGPVGTNGNGKFLFQVGTRSDSATSIALQPDGKIVIAGQCDQPVGSTDMCVARLNADGSLDGSFDGPLGNSNGAFLLALGGGTDSANAVAIQEDGKLVVAGGCGVQGCVARLNVEQHCNPDVDGDGVASATVDGLILTRAMIGIQGNALVGGITFPQSATRNTWPLVRAYLTRQCGMTFTQ
jgi:uncharacterized delta-60 repeat protein